MTCHFVYSVPYNLCQTPTERIKNKIRGVLNDMDMSVGLISNREPSEADFTAWPIRSPFENTKHIYSALAARMHTRLYHLSEHVRCKFGPDDIFIGHPYFPHKEGGYGVTELAVREIMRPKKLALISPLHCDVNIKSDHINKDFLDDIDKLLPSADILFGIMGEYWWDQWDKSPYAHWKPKMIRLDMAVDTTRYPRIKNSFNPKGKRGYLYIGNSSDPRKGTEFLSCLMSNIVNCRVGWIGYGPDIPNVPRIAELSALSPEFMASIASEYDFFISPAVADPNPTTILESMSWGFPVVCTPQSGYYETNYMKNIFLDDLERSIEVLTSLQYMDDFHLIQMSNTARNIVESKYTWCDLTSKIISSLDIQS